MTQRLDNDTPGAIWPAHLRAKSSGAAATVHAVRFQDAERRPNGRLDYLAKVTAMCGRGVFLAFDALSGWSLEDQRGEECTKCREDIDGAGESCR